MPSPQKNLLPTVLLVSFTLTCLTLLVHIDYLSFAYLDEGNQLRKQIRLMAGEAGDPWQYRMLTAYIADSMIQAMYVMGVENRIGISFILLRFLISFFLFIVAYYYFMALELGNRLSIAGLILISWSMTHANYDSGLSFNTYLDITFFLLAGWIILRGNAWLVLPLCIFSAVNRETGLMIPALSFAYAMIHKPQGHKQLARISFLSGLAYIAVLLTVRNIYGPQPIVGAYGAETPTEMFAYNFSSSRGAIYFFATMNIFPVLAIIAYKSCHPFIRTGMVVMAPAWLIIHLFVAVLAETRVMLALQCLVFIPAALHLLLPVTNKKEERASLRETPVIP